MEWTEAKTIHRRFILIRSIEAAKADNRTDAAETKKDQTQKAENKQENADTATDASENADVKTETAETIKNPASESGQSVVYTPIDIRL